MKVCPKIVPNLGDIEIKKKQKSVLLKWFHYNINKQKCNKYLWHFTAVVRDFPTRGAFLEPLFSLNPRLTS